MKLPCLVAPIGACLLLSGCGTPSLHTVAPPGAVITDPGLAGRWLCGDDAEYTANVTLNGSEYAVALTVTQPGQSMVTVPLEVRLTEIGGLVYADLYLARTERDLLAGRYGFLVLPVHQIARVARDGDSLNVAFFTGEWVGRAAERGALAVARVPLGGNESAAIAVGSTERLRSYLAKHGGDPRTFSAPLNFKRQP
jgi:hypothetical protein